MLCFLVYHIIISDKRCYNLERRLWLIENVNILTKSGSSRSFYVKELLSISSVVQAIRFTYSLGNKSNKFLLTFF